MGDEKEYLLYELREHTTDCDCAKVQHYHDEKECRENAKKFKIKQTVFFLLTITTYVLLASDFKIADYTLFKVASALLTIGCTLLEIVSYMLRYDDEAMEHWKAAQMYAELYRKCQFFCSDYYNASLDVWREKLSDISEELSRLALMSPAVSKESYSEWDSNKTYPVDKAIASLKKIKIEEVADSIKDIFAEQKIEIYVYGSYMNTLHYDDIDIAVIVHETEFHNELVEKINGIESEYSLKGIKIDITVIYETDLKENVDTCFIKNILKGKCLYRSKEIATCLQNYTETQPNYKDMAEYFLNHAKNNLEDFRVFSTDAFYMYYYTLTALLDKLNIAWNGEASMLMECEKLAMDSKKLLELDLDIIEFKELIKHVRYFFKEKNCSYLKENNSNLELLIEFYNKDVERVKKILISK